MNPIFDYTVYDRTGDKVGTVDNIWENQDHELTFIGVSTGWLGLGQNHLVPMQAVTVDHNDRSLTVEYDESIIKNSPSYESSAPLSVEEEIRIYRHYGMDAPETSGLPAGQSWDARRETARSDSKVSDQETVEVPLAEERLEVRKREVDLGEVRLRKVVRTETVNQPVELRREEVVVERVQGKAGRPGEEAFTEKVVTIPVREEEAEVRKKVQSAGAVQARKETATEVETISEQVRREDVEVEKDYARERR